MDNYNGPRACSLKVFIRLSLFFIFSALETGETAAGEWEFSGMIAGETRFFPTKPEFSKQNNTTFSPSASIQARILYEWNDGRDRLTAVPFARLDAHDNNRTHGDFREANWLHLGERWDLVVGLDKVFWGVTESRHLVDIINQDDRVEDIDGEDKLGQPMVNLTLLRNWGRLGVFVLPGFRERTFPANDARLRGPLPIADDDPTFDSGAKDKHIDFALRWAHSIGDWDLGASHFHGTSREPRLIERDAPSGDAVLVPHYDQIDQTGIDLQLTSGAWLWKLEAMTRSGQGDRFFATVGGFEFTLFSVFDTPADLGLLAEYLYDGRDPDEAPPTSADDDVFFGTRFSLNDVQDTSALVGAVIDRRSGATFLSVEAERRIGDSWKIELEGRLLANLPRDDPLFGIRKDDFVTLRLSKFF
jgi:hypothetical protein